MELPLSELEAKYKDDPAELEWLRTEIVASRELTELPMQSHRQQSFQMFFGMVSYALVAQNSLADHIHRSGCLVRRMDQTCNCANCCRQDPKNPKKRLYKLFQGYKHDSVGLKRLLGTVLSSTMTPYPLRWRREEHWHQHCCSGRRRAKPSDAPGVG